MEKQTNIYTPKCYMYNGFSTNLKKCDFLLVYSFPTNILHQHIKCPTIS